MVTHWQQALQAEYGISARLKRLVGEHDLNFFASADDAEYVFKVMHIGCDPALVDMQCSTLEYLRKHLPNLAFPKVFPCKNGPLFCEAADETGTPRLIWVQQRMAGVCYADFNPKSLGLIGQLGRQIGQIDKALMAFSHPYLGREFPWHLPSGNWISPHLDAVESPDRQALLQDILGNFATIQATLSALPQQAIHNDLNDYNILISTTPSSPAQISGLIDFGDMTTSPRICELAIAGAYIVLDHPQPEAALAALVQGYHTQNPLTETEVDLIWPLLQMRLAVSVVNATLVAKQRPDDPYVTITQIPAWRFLETAVDAGLIQARLRVACGFPVTKGADNVLDYLARERGNFASLFDQDLTNAPMGPLSVSQTAIPQNPFDLPLAEAALIGSEYDDNGKPWLGYYGEPRLIYTADAFRNGPWKASNRRTVHLAIDVFLPAETPLYTPLDAVVEVVENRNNHLDYGGVIILRHTTPDGTSFYTLYGHLNPEFITRLKPGDSIAKGTAFCQLGDPTQNGGWAPHVHFQLAMTTDGMGHDWPGVADPDEMNLWGAICPNPAALLNLQDEKTSYQPMNRDAILADRQTHFGRNVKLSYNDPVMFLRGWQHHLFDEWGRPFLDAYNNVPHVGHAHPRIQAVAADQLKRMNANTRYLHPAQTAFADKILSKMPDTLSVCFFVNSGTEANELALRLARAHTGGKDMITPDHGYHGNTTGAIDISAYKFNKPGGTGQQDWVHLVDVADDYKGRFRRDDPNRAAKYAAQVDTTIAKAGKLAGWICETFPSVGGQIIPPKGYLQAVYQKIRAAGGICIADEVQTGLGRLGEYYFGFEQQQVVPDIVVLGKPIGNGHPLGVLVTTAEIAESFAQGPEYFSTFGGSTLSCRMGHEVLDIVDDEGLQYNAAKMGALLLEGLRNLQSKHAVIGDVRGIGLFIGVELVSNRETREPATKVTSYVLNRMREERILMGAEGPADNILKIRPPLTIAPDDVEMILETLDRVLAEDASQTS